MKARLSYNNQFDNDFNIITLAEFLADPDNDRALDALTGIPARDIDFGGALGGTRKDFLAYVNTLFHLRNNVTFSVNPYYQTLDGESFRYQDRQRRLSGTDPRAVLGYNALGGAIRPALITTRNSNVVGGPADMRVTPRDRERYGITSEFRIVNLIHGHTVRFGGWWEGGDSTEDREFYPITNSAVSIAFDRNNLAYVEYARTATVETTMLYAQDRIDVIRDLLRADLGVTWFDIRYRATSPLEYRPVVRFSQSSGLNPKIGIGLTPTRGLEIFAGYAQNFAGIPEDAFLGSNAVINPGDLDPIETENFDAGIRFVRGPIALSAQAYHVRLKNNIGIIPRNPAQADPEDVIRGNVATRAANVRGATTKGFELTAIGEFDWVSFYGAYSYQDARHDNPPLGSSERLALASVGVIGGARVRDIPRHNLYGQVSFEPMRGATIQFNGRYVSSRVGGHLIQPVTFVEIGVQRIPDYSVFGINASYEFPNTSIFRELRIQFNVDNIFDEDYIGSVSSATTTLPDFGLVAGGSVPTLDRYFIGAPRTFTASIRARF